MENSTKGSRTLALCLTPAVGLTNGNFLPTCLVVTYSLTLLLYKIYRLQNLSDIDFDLLRSLKVKCDGVIGLPMYGFLLIYIVITSLTLTT